MLALATGDRLSSSSYAKGAHESPSLLQLPPLAAAAPWPTRYATGLKPSIRYKLALRSLGRPARPLLQQHGPLKRGSGRRTELNQRPLN